MLNVATAGVPSPDAAPDINSGGLEVRRLIYSGTPGSSVDLGN